MNITLRELIYDYAGGIRDGRQLKAVIPGGSSVPVLLPDQLDVQASFDGVAKAGSMLGSAGIIVMDDTTCMVWAATNLLHFYRHESCGKCTPCREGGDWLLQDLRKIERGEGHMSDLDLLMSVANNIAGKTLCPFGDAAATPVLSTLKQFRGEFEAHIREGRCTLPGRLARAPAGGCALMPVVMRAIGSGTSALGIVGRLSVMNHRSALVASSAGPRGLLALLLSAAVMVWMERKVAACCSSAFGPTYIGPAGLLQPFADVFKLLFKEELRPAAADTFLF